MLYVGERLGAEGPAVDIAVDPLDGTTIASRGASGAVTRRRRRSARLAAVFASFVYGEDRRMPRARGSTIDRSQSHRESHRDRAGFDRSPSELVVAMLDRPRNEAYAAAVRELGARTKLFGDGDIVNAAFGAFGRRPRDALVGIGGAPEGVITACAVRALGGDMCARFWLRDERDRAIAESENIDVRCPSRSAISAHRS